MRLSCASQATYFNDFTYSEDHVKEVILRVIGLDSARISQLTHQEDKLSLALGGGRSPSKSRI